MAFFNSAVKKAVDIEDLFRMRCTLLALALLGVDAADKGGNISSVRFHDLDGLTDGELILLLDLRESSRIALFRSSEIDIVLYIRVAVVDLGLGRRFSKVKTCGKLTVSALSDLFLVPLHVRFIFLRILQIVIDALPVEEENDLPFKSEVPGVMHACGHDIHTAVLLTFAKVLTAHPELVRGTVKLIFQAAEEKLPGGAKALCEEGVMKDVDLIYGFHCASAFPLGTIAVTPRAYSAAIGIYEVKIHGKGGHGGYPQNALNPVPVACMVGSALNQILAEKKNPLEGGVLTVSYINGGQYPNIITDTVTLGGNVRTLNNDLIDKVFDSIHSISRGICAGFGLTCDVTTTLGYPAAINVPEEIETVRSVTRDLGYTVYERPDALGGEDFAYYLLEKPGAYFQIGMADPERPITSSPHHNCHFQLDERGISEALEMELGLYLRVTGQM